MRHGHGLRDVGARLFHAVSMVWTLVGTGIALGGLVLWMWLFPGRETLYAGQDATAHVTIDLLAVIGFLALVLLGLLSFIGTRIFGRLDALDGGVGEVNKSLGTLNGSVGKLNVWTEQHEKLDDDRHKTLTDNQRAQWDEIGKLNEKLT